MAKKSKYDVPTGAGKDLKIKGRVGPKTAAKLGAAACIKKGGKWVGGKCTMAPKVKAKEVSTIFPPKKPKKKRSSFWNPRGHKERGSGKWGYLRPGKNPISKDK